MRRILITITFLGAVYSPHVIADEFSEPWKNPSTALVIDPFYGNDINWNKMGSETRLAGIIHKATIGTSKVDPKYYERKAKAKKLGYLWGSYHFGLAGTPEKQADFYLETVKPADDEVMALDLEDTMSNKFMGIAKAIKFIARIKEKTGRYPMVYVNNTSAFQISNSASKSAFKDTPLWYARFRRDIPDFPKGAWATYTLWQFSSEINVQYRIPGTQADMDINVFNGSVDEVRKAWPFTKK